MDKEKLTDEELDNVTGGSVNECKEIDNAIGDENHDVYEYFRCPGLARNYVAIAYGCEISDVRVVLRQTGENEYYVKDKRVSQKDFIKRLYKKYGGEH